MTSFFRRLAWRLTRRRKDAELAEELRFHVDEETADRQDAGASADAARRDARLDFGNPAVVAENTRAAWGWTRLEQVARDTRYGLRQVRRNPMFSGLAIAKSTIGARLREGRFFGPSDRRSSSPVAIVNETFANRHFAGRSALGARFQYGQLDDKGYWYTIVGVVKEIHEVGMEEDARPAVYKLNEQADQIGSDPSTIVVRTSVAPETVVAAVQRAIWSLDKNEPIARMQTFEDIMARQLATPSQSTALLSAFAILALFLAALGLYGVLSHAVTERTDEIGLRMALGATSSDILRAFGGRGMALTLTGLAMGVMLAAIAAQLITTLFYGVRPDYLPAVGLVSLVLLAVAALACFIPARRASRIDPVVALRHG